MPQIIDVAGFCRLMKDQQVIDVRSPSEYLKGHIAGSVNIPLFSNQERAIVGTTYVLEGQQEAVKIGEELAWKRTGFFDEKLKATVSGNSLLMYCWRGGLRSAGMAQYYENKGYRVTLLSGGYKAYRRYIRQQFTKPCKMVLLGGNTGSGKTDILACIQRAGNQVIDLESLACHKGSAFGHLGEKQQPTTEHFENLLFRYWDSMDPGLDTWLEHESLNIGNVFLPDTLYEAMKRSRLLIIKVPIEERINRIVAGYSSYPAELLRDSILHIRMRLGTLQAKSALESLQREDFHKVAEILLVYYDKLYEHALEKWPKEQIEIVRSATGDPEKNAELLLSCVK